MRGYLIKVGTTVAVIKEDAEWKPDEFQYVSTTKENCFFTEDIVVDPLGVVGIGPGHSGPAAEWAKHGFYGFKRDGWILLVATDLIAIN